MRLTYKITEKMQIKEYLKIVGLSRNFCRKIKLYGKMYVNHQEAKNHEYVNIGDELVIEYDEKINHDIPLVAKSVEVIYEDECFLIVNKEAGISTQPSKKHHDNLISRIKNYLSKDGSNFNVHIVNRLDLATSGLVIAAKNSYIKEEFQRIKIIKKYLAIAKGSLEVKEGVINLGIKRDPNHAIKRMISEDGQIAITKYKVIEVGNINLDLKDETELIELELLTGRTHQIRLHLNAIGHPIIGDLLYNITECSETKLHLHSYYLEFLHPMTKESLKFINYPNWND